MKKHIIAAIVLVCLIVPAHAAFAGNRGHDDHLLSQLIEMSIFPHRYLVPAIKYHGSDHRYSHHDNRNRRDGHHNYHPDNRYNSRRGDYDSYNDRHHDRRRDHNRSNNRKGHGGYWE